MVCDRCIRVVKEELEAAGFPTIDVQLGRAIVESPGDTLDRDTIQDILEVNGFELLLDKKARLVEQVKAVVINLIYQDQLEELNRNLSEIIAERVGRDYSILSKLFTSVESTTIEKFVIMQKIERAKELLIYEELNLSEIAFRLGYSSVQHLSSQFKKITGLTPSHFKTIKARRRKAIDQLTP